MTHTAKCPKRDREYQTGSFAFLSGFFAGFFALHDLRHEISHCLCRSILLLSGGVGVSAQGEARVVVPQHTADCFDVYTILECQGRECVSEVVKADVFQARVLQYLFVELYYRVWVVHLPSDRRGEQVRIVWVLAVFLNQQGDCVLRDGYLSDGCLRLRPGEHHLPAGVADVLLTGGDGLAGLMLGLA